MLPARLGQPNIIDLGRFVETVLLFLIPASQVGPGPDQYPNAPFLAISAGHVQGSQLLLITRLYVDAGRVEKLGSGLRVT